MSLQVYFLIAQTEVERKTFLEGARRGAALWDYPQEHLVVTRDKKSLSLCGIRNNTNLPLLFIRPPYKKVLQSMQFYVKFVDRFQGLSRESFCHQGEGLIRGWSF